MWVIGVYIKMNFERLFYVLLYIVIKSQYEVEQEELEFNGRWCDDGGRNVE